MCPQDSGLEYTFIRVGEIVEGKEGGSVMVANTTDDLPVEQVVRDDIIRLSAEAFMMQNATNKVIHRTAVNPCAAIESKTSMEIAVDGMGAIALRLCSRHISLTPVYSILTILPIPATFREALGD